MSERPPMGELQALVAGYVLGSLMRAPEYGITIEVEQPTDELGFLPELHVRGLRSAERLVVRIEEVAE